MTSRTPAVVVEGSAKFLVWPGCALPPVSASLLYWQMY